MKYDSSLKEAVLRRILPPTSESMSKVSRDTGIALQTLISWKKKALSEGVEFEDPSEDDGLSSKEKFRIVVETDTMDSVALAAYAESKGVYVEQILAWREVCENANANYAKETRRLHQVIKDKDKLIKSLQAELEKKDKALAEVAALEVLGKKSSGVLSGPRGRMISSADRLQCLELIEKAKAQGASLQAACKEMGIDERTYYRWKKKLRTTGTVDDLRPSAERADPYNRYQGVQPGMMPNYGNPQEMVNPYSNQLVPQNMMPSYPPQAVYPQSPMPQQVVPYPQRPVYPQSTMPHAMPQQVMPQNPYQPQAMANPVSQVNEMPVQDGLLQEEEPLPNSHLHRAKTHRISRKVPRKRAIVSH